MVCVPIGRYGRFQFLIDRMDGKQPCASLNRTLMQKQNITRRSQPLSAIYRKAHVIRSLGHCVSLSNYVRGASCYLVA